MRRLDGIVIHYTATYADRVVTVAEIDRWHKDRGFSGIGYHFVIDQKGVIYGGRPIAQAGAHVRGYNANTVGITYVGGLKPGTAGKIGYDTRTSAQKIAIRGQCARLLKKYPSIRWILGHKDLAPTQCPGFDAKTEYAAMTEHFSSTPGKKGSCDWFNTVINGGQPRNER
jgi:N-acetylmuramoyl-L-alanine amidase